MNQFTNDWFQGHKSNWEQIFSVVDKNLFLDCLEIGSYEGQSTIGILNMFPNCTVTCVDTWEGQGQGDVNDNYKEIYERFQNNIKPFGNRVKVVRDSSYTALPALATSKQQFDLIYVDGSHHSAEVLFDAVLSFQLLRVGGIVIFDDYAWEAFQEKHMLHHNPKLAIDSFLAAYNDETHIIYKGWQVFVQKIKNRL